MGAPADAKADAEAAAVTAALLGPLEAHGVDLEAVEIQQAGRRQTIRVVIDRDGGVDLDLIAEVSQAVSELLDRPPLAEQMSGPFVLEVTSPGVDRPLTQTRHWRRAVGRLVQVELRDGTQVSGRVVGVDDDDGVTLDTTAGSTELARKHVARAVVQVEFV